MIFPRWVVVCVAFVCMFALCNESLAGKRRKRKNPYKQLTHPVVLWSKTLSSSTNLEERRVAAFKLSQYTQRIFQSSVIGTLHSCILDPDLKIRIFCARAMQNAGRNDHEDAIRKSLLELFNKDPDLKNTVVRTFISRGDESQTVHDTFLQTLKKTKKQEDRLVLLQYFEKYGSGSGSFVDDMNNLYKKYPDSQTRRSIAKALSDHGKSQTSIIELLSSCATGNDTPLALTCLDGLEKQGKNDQRSWAAVEKTIEQDDPDVLIASLDLIIDLPETTNVKIASRLLEIIDNSEEVLLQEKAVLALGSTGDQSEEITKTLLDFMENDETDEAVKIASALSLGRQGAVFSEKPLKALDACSKEGKSQNYKTACQLGLQDLENRKKLKAASSSPPNPAAIKP